MGAAHNNAKVSEYTGKEGLGTEEEEERGQFYALSLSLVLRDGGIDTGALEVVLTGQTTFSQSASFAKKELSCL